MSMELDISAKSTSIHKSKKSRNKRHKIPETHSKLSKPSANCMAIVDEITPSKFVCSNKKMSRILKINTRGMDKDDIEKKRNLLEMLFNNNYDRAELSPAKRRDENAEEDYSPGFKNLMNRGGGSPWKGTMRSNNVYEQAQSSVLNIRKSGSSLNKYHDNNYDFSTTALPNTSSNTKFMKRSNSMVQDSGDREASPLKAIKQIRYNEKEDRTVALRERLAIKKSVLKDQIHKKALLLRKRNQKHKSQLNEVAKYVTNTHSFDGRTRQRSESDSGYLSKMNDGIIKRYKAYLYFLYSLI